MKLGEMKEEWVGGEWKECELVFGWKGEWGKKGLWGRGDGEGGVKYLWKG